MNYRDLALRAAKTAVQSFTAVLMAGGAGFLDIATVRAAGVAALAGLIALANNWASGAELVALVPREPRERPREPTFQKRGGYTAGEKPVADLNPPARGPAHGARPALRDD